MKNLYSFILRAVFVLVAVVFTHHLTLGNKTIPEPQKCLRLCPRIYQPVCGLSCCQKKNVTFGNYCEMEASNRCDGTDYIQICNMTCDQCGGIVCRSY